MSNGTPACSIGAVDARWLFPQERAPSSPPRKTRLDDCEALLASVAKLDTIFSKINAAFANFEAKVDATFANSEAKVDATLANFEAKVTATLDDFEAKVTATVDAALKTFTTFEALRARPGIAPSVHIPSSTTTWMSLPTAAGSTLWIEEVCTRQDAHFEASLVDFWSFTDNLDLRQPSTHVSFASLDDDDDDHDKDKAIPIVRSIDNADAKFEDIPVVLAPPPPLPYTGAVVPFLGGKCPLSSPNMLSAFELATVPPQKTACRLKRPRCWAHNLSVSRRLVLQLEVQEGQDKSEQSS